MKRKAAVGIVIGFVAILGLAVTVLLLGVFLNHDIVVDDWEVGASGWNQFMGSGAHIGSRGFSEGGTGTQIWTAEIGPVATSPGFVARASGLLVHADGEYVLKGADVALATSQSRLVMIHPKDGRVMRTVDLGENITTSPVASLGAVLVGSENGTIYWVDLAYEEVLKAGGFGRIEATPAFASQFGVVADVEGKVRKFDLKGPVPPILWTAQVNASVIAPVTTSPVGYLLVGTGGTVFMLHGANGQLTWTVSTGHTTSTSAVSMREDAAVASDDGWITAIEGETGVVDWTRELGHRISGHLSYLPRSHLGDEGTLFVGTADGQMLALDALTGSTIWTTKVGGAIATTPAIAATKASSEEQTFAHVFFGSDDGHVYALNAETGELRWKHDTGAPVRSSPIVVDGILYVGTQTGLLALDAGHLDDASATAAGGDAARPIPGPAPTVVLLLSLGSAPLARRRH